jgi:uncharacterized ion transporter superfamily protein YfcC
VDATPMKLKPRDNTIIAIVAPTIAAIVKTLKDQKPYKNWIKFLFVKVAILTSIKALIVMTPEASTITLKVMDVEP